MIVVGAMIVSVLVRTFLVQAFFVPSGSMEQTLLPSDRIVAAKIETKISGVHRGEIVVFSDPGGWLGTNTVPTGFGETVRKALQFVGVLPADGSGHLVKRVIGLGGDRVQCCDVQGRIEVNGVSLAESYLAKGVVTNQIAFNIVVPADSIFVLGDNRPFSADSRYHLGVNAGSVPLSDVVGKVVAIIWPFGRMQLEHTPGIFAAIPNHPKS